ncbi:hypothetical protein sync_1855 [Synechococcus sp. CC9311]|nr:hypothetical protein sync_1855 [Synechococcus sp. CC9311]
MVGAFCCFGLKAIDQSQSACSSAWFTSAAITTDIAVFAVAGWSPRRIHIEQIGKDICAEHPILSVKRPLLLPPVYPLKRHFRSDIAIVFA